MRNLLSKLAILLLASLPTLAYAESQTIAIARSADDTDVAFIVKYTGPSTAFMTTANNTITFEEGNNSTVTTDFECPVSAPLGGIIDTSNAACNTVGEICAIINAAPQWACVPIDALASDDASALKLLAASDVAVTGDAGGSAKWDTTVALTSTIALLPAEARDINYYYSYNVSGNKIFRTDPYNFKGLQPHYYYSAVTSTYGSGTSLYSLYTTKWTGQGTNTLGTESSVIGPYFNLAAGNTTVAKEFTTFASTGLPAQVGEKVIVRLTNSAAMASVQHSAIGVLK